MKYFISDNAMSLFFDDGTSLMLEKSNANYHAILNLLLKATQQNREVTPVEEGVIKELSKPDKFVEAASNGNMRIHEGAPQLKTPDGWIDIDSHVHDRLNHFLDEGIPLDPFMKFYASLNKNVSLNSREQLFDFIDNREMPVTPDGEVIGYKGVDSEFMDIWSGKVHNHIGAVVKMDRRKVDDNPQNSCSYGFHIGSHQYANSWRGGDESNNKLLLVAFKPEDAVSVPNDGCEKLRVCEYRVIADITSRPHALHSPAYTADGKSVQKIEPYREKDRDGLDWSETSLYDFRIVKAKATLYQRLNQGKRPKIVKFLAKHHLTWQEFNEHILSDDNITTTPDDRIQLNWDGQLN